MNGPVPQKSRQMELTNQVVAETEMELGMPMNISMKMVNGEEVMLYVIQNYASVPSV